MRRIDNSQIFTILFGDIENKLYFCKRLILIKEYMDRQVTIQLESPMFDYISIKAAENNVSVATFISNYILQTLLLPSNSTNAALTSKKAMKKAKLHSLRGILASSPKTDEEAMDEYISEKYAL